MHYTIIFSIFLIFCGAAFLATCALFTRQSLLVAYIVLGAILGPWGIGLVSDSKVIQEIGQIGIIFLLFLLGLNLEPQNLIKMLRQTTLITLLSAGAFGLIGFLIGLGFGFSTIECLVIGSCMMYSSTIIGLKLLPTTILHNQRMGEIVISILLLQDIIAIFTLLIIEGAGTGGGLSWVELLRILIGLPAMVIGAFLFEKYILNHLFARFNRIHEYLFLVAIGWCLGLGQLAEYLKLSFEIGAFIAGISIATSPIARFIAESLKPLRDFFLIMFFFSLGAGLNIHILPSIIVPAGVLAIAMLIFKPLIFRFLLVNTVGAKSKSKEIGVRIGQISEFSLLVAVMAYTKNLIDEPAYNMIQSATILTFIVSSYWIVQRYPTPIALSEKLRRD